ncbi:MAG: lipoprotein [Steroidobacteraceae bacterium]
MTRIPSRLLALVAAGVALAACGQKGPLYLPDSGNVIVRPPPAATPAPAPETAPAPEEKDKKKSSGP